MDEVLIKTGMIKRLWQTFLKRSRLDMQEILPGKKESRLRDGDDFQRGLHLHKGWGWSGNRLWISNWPSSAAGAFTPRVYLCFRDQRCIRCDAHPTIPRWSYFATIITEINPIGIRMGENSTDQYYSEHLIGDTLTMRHTARWGLRSSAGRWPAAAGCSGGTTARR